MVTVNFLGPSVSGDADQLHGSQTYMGCNSLVSHAIPLAPLKAFFFFFTQLVLVPNAAPCPSPPSLCFHHSLQLQVFCQVVLSPSGAHYMVISVVVLNVFTAYLSTAGIFCAKIMYRSSYLL